MTDQQLDPIDDLYTGDPAAYAIKIYGTPAPKGSMRHLGKGRPILNANPATQPWQNLLAYAFQQWHLPQPIDQPVTVHATITLPRPISTNPKSRPYPSKKSPGHGDIDKLARTILDALQDAAVIRDDAQVIQLHTTKLYPDSPQTQDRLDKPGAIIRLWELS
jgi:crossover junction endodeoxyribonuclease RusA